MKNWILASVLLGYSGVSFAENTRKLSEKIVDSPAGENLIQVTFGLVVVLVFILLIAWILKRSGRFQAGSAAQFKILGGLSLGARERIVLVQIADSQILIGVAPGLVRTLHVFSEDEKVTAIQDVQVTEKPFKDRLDAALIKKVNDG